MKVPVRSRSFNKSITLLLLIAAVQFLVIGMQCIALHWFVVR
jgi:uncharacterized membrane protein HdeD (DUF308 family)